MSWQIAVAGVLAAASFSAGWEVNEWRRDSAALAAENAAKAVIAKQGEVAAQVEERLSQLKVAERVIDRGVVREVRNNETIYRNVCLPDSGRLLINAAAAGANPDDTTGQVPRNPAGPR